MFELESALRDWTARFDRTEAMRRSDIEELEQHVRDSLAVLTASGLSEEEAFLIATHRVGPAVKIEREFHKANGSHVWGRRMLWMLSGYLLFTVSQLTISAIATFSQAIIAFVGGSGTTIGYAAIAVTAFCWLALAVWICRYSGMQYREHASDGDASKSRSLLIPIGLAALIVATTLLKFGSQVVVVRLTPTEAFAQSISIYAYANALFALLLPIVCVVSMLIIRARMRVAPESASLLS